MTDKTLVEKMAEVMAEVGYVQKDATNDFQHYSYASAAAVMSKVNAALSSRGIAVSGGADLVHFEMVDGGKKSMAVVNQTLVFTDGKDSLTVQALGQGVDSGDKAAMKANTAGTKYALAKAFMISWGDDPEADPATDAVEDSAALLSWLDEVAKLGNESRATVVAWWPSMKAQVKKQCGQADAARVWDALQTVLASKPEVADEG